MVTESPNAKYDHVYAIIRLDRDAATGGIPDRNLIMVKKVVRSKEVAEQEVARLNRLNADKGCEYYYQITRLEREPKEQNEQAPLPS
jgi:hypothetical protein